jgi:hypothetical protein
MDIRLIRGKELSNSELDSLVRDFMAIRDKVLTPSMQKEYADGETYYKEQLLDAENIVVCSFNGEGHAVAYVAGVPHQSIYAELKEYDFCLEQDLKNECYYVENIASIAQSLSAHKVVLKLINELIREADRRGRKYITMHCRIINGLSHIISSFFPVELERVIPNWFYTNEPTHYLVGHIDQVKWLQKEKRNSGTVLGG